jgi:hypothetical protein
VELDTDGKELVVKLDEELLKVVNSKLISSP